MPTDRTPYEQQASALLPCFCSEPFAKAHPGRCPAYYRDRIASALLAVAQEKERERCQDCGGERQCARCGPLAMRAASRLGEAEAAFWRIPPNTHTSPADPFEGPGETYRAAYARELAARREAEAAVLVLREALMEQARCTAYYNGAREPVSDEKARDYLRPSAKNALSSTASLAAQVREQIAQEAAEEEQRSIADWYEETFCPDAGVGTDEKHARGDCEHCNVAAAIRSRTRKGEPPCPAK